MRRTQGQFPNFPGTVTVGRLILTSGVVDQAVLDGHCPEPNAQAQAALRTLLSSIEDAGGSCSSVLRVEAFLADVAHMGAWADAFAGMWPTDAPCRTTTVTGLALPALAIELQATAVQAPGYGRVQAAVSTTRRVAVGAMTSLRRAAPVTAHSGLRNGRQAPKRYDLST